MFSLRRLRLVVLRSVPAGAALCLGALSVSAAAPEEAPFGVEIVPLRPAGPQQAIHSEDAQVAITPAFAPALFAGQNAPQESAPAPVEAPREEAANDESSPAPAADGEDVVTIQPLFDQQTILTRAASYADVYRSIPFSRAEYEANPSYRHDATMEILFGQLRPTVIHRSQTPIVRSHSSLDLSRPRRNWYTSSPYRVYRGYYGYSYQYACPGGWFYRVR